MGRREDGDELGLKVGGCAAVIRGGERGLAGEEDNRREERVERGERSKES